MPTSSLSDVDLMHFVYRAFDFEGKLQALVAFPGLPDTRLAEPFVGEHRVVAVSDRIQGESGDNLEVYHHPFYRSVPFNADYYIGMPESGVIDAPMLSVRCAEFGMYGPSSRADEQSAMVELCLSGARRFVVCLLTRKFVLGSKFTRMRAWLRASNATEILRLVFPEEALDDHDESMMLLAWHVGNASRRDKPVWSRVADAEELDVFLSDWKKSNWRATIMDEWKVSGVTQRSFDPDSIIRDKPNFVSRSSEHPDYSVRVCVDGSGGSLRLVASNPESLSKLDAVRNTLATKRNQVTKQKESVLDFRLKARSLVKGDSSLDGIVDLLEKSGFDVTVSDDVEGWLGNIERRHFRESIPFEQNILTPDGWEETFKDAGVTSELEGLYQHWRREIEKRIEWPLWEFSKHDLARLLCKPNAIYAAFMGAGKTRMAMSYIEMLGGRRNLIVLQSRLVGEFIEEAEKIGFPVDDIHVISGPEDADPSKLKRLNLISYSRVWRPVNKKRRPLPEDANKNDKPRACKTIAHVLRKVRFSALIFDEAHYLKGGISTKQGEFSLLFRAKHRLLMSGTVARNYPRNLYALFVRAFGEFSTASLWSYRVPVEHPEKPDVCTSGTRVFSQKYVETTYVTSQFEDTLEGKKGRELPRVPSESLDDWHEMLQPKVLRRQRKEPDVLKDIPLPEPDYKEIEFPVSQEHAEFYWWWLESYFDWFESEMQREQESGGDYTMNQGAILAQLNKLQFAATIPQSDKVAIKRDDGEYTVRWDGGLTTKQEGIIGKVIDAVLSGEKVIVFSKRPDLLALFDERFNEDGFETAIITGSMKMDDRDVNKNLFRSPDGPSILLMTLGAGNTGYNLPEADTVWLSDYDWVPSTMQQAAARMLRADWLTEERLESGAEPKIRQAVQMGTIDEYMRQLVDLKSEGLSQALDKQDAEFDPDNWLSYRDFSIRMFKELGFDI